MRKDGQAKCSHFSRIFSRVIFHQTPHVGTRSRRLDTSSSRSVRAAAAEDRGPRAVMRSPSTVTLVSRRVRRPRRAGGLHLVFDPVRELPAVGHQVVSSTMPSSQAFGKPVTERPSARNSPSLSRVKAESRPRDRRRVPCRRRRRRSRAAFTGVDILRDVPLRAVAAGEHDGVVVRGVSLCQRNRVVQALVGLVDFPNVFREVFDDFFDVDGTFVNTGGSPVGVATYYPDRRL